MGEAPNISHDQFPRQSDNLGRRVIVCFNYDTEHQLSGIIVRDDIEEPGQMMISLDDGRIVRSVECMYKFEAS